MFKRLYGTTRDRNYSFSISLEEISMNGGYNTEFFNRGQFRDYEEAGIVNLSMPIPNERYTGVLPKIDENEQIIGTVPKLTRFVMLRYSDVYTNPEDLKASIEKSSSDTAVQIFETPEAAKVWLRANTDLPERSDGVFVVRVAFIDPMGTQIDEELLIIE